MAMPYQPLSLYVRQQLTNNACRCSSVIVRGNKWERERGKRISNVRFSACANLKKDACHPLFQGAWLTLYLLFSLSLCQTFYIKILLCLCTTLTPGRWRSWQGCSSWPSCPWRPSLRTWSCSRLLRSEVNVIKLFLLRHWPWSKISRFGSRDTLCSLV